MSFNVFLCVSMELRVTWLLFWKLLCLVTNNICCLTDACNNLPLLAQNMETKAEVQVQVGAASVS